MTNWCTFKDGSKGVCILDKDGINAYCTSQILCGHQCKSDANCTANSFCGSTLKVAVSNYCCGASCLTALPDDPLGIKAYTTNR